MRFPVHFTVHLPDGSEHGVSTITWGKNGRIRKIETFGINGDSLKNGWYTIEGEELELVQLEIHLRTDDD